MTDLRKAAEMALEALHNIDQSNNDDAIEALGQALAQPEQEPVAWVIEDGEVDYYVDVVAKIKPGTPLYTAPPKREWKELDVNDVMGLIAEHITDPSPELMDELYGLIAGADMLLQEKNA